MENEYDITAVVPAHNGKHYTKQPLLSTPAYELRSEEIQDIIGKMPHWIIRQGTAVLFAVILLLFAAAYFMHYPDIIITNVTITSSNPPVKLVAQSSGKIQQIFIKDNQEVSRNQNLCLLENLSDYRDIVMLKSLLRDLDSTALSPQALRMISLPPHVRLGELQSGYADLFQSVHQLLFFKEKNFVTQKVEQLQSQIGYQSRVNEELQNRDKLLKEQLMLENKKYLADSSLVKDKVIAPLEFDNSRKELINKQMNADATKTSILENKLQQTEYLKTITDLQQQKLQREYDLTQQIRDNVKRLQGQLELWEQKYVIKSPVNGKAVFFKFWKENQYVTNGEAVLMVVPPVQNYVAKASLPIDGAGKVKASQKVLIKLSSYPFEEFGMIRGRVEAVSAVALDTAYSMEIQLTNGLTTTAKKQIPAQPQLAGIAEVVTSDRNILERLFEKVWLRYRE